LRTQLLFPVTLGVMGLWCLAAALTLQSGFPAGPVLRAILFVAAAYAIGVTLFRSRSG
jgi:hypothetical protein